MTNTPSRAFSSEMENGSRQENASNQESRAPFRFNRNGKALGQPVDGLLLAGRGAVHPPYRFMAIKWRPAKRARPINRKQLCMGRGRLLKACLVALAFAAAVTATRPAQAQTNFDRPGGDYQNSPVPSGDPADCALVCERDRRCRAWSFNYPTDTAGGAVCWLQTHARTQ